MNTHPPHEPWEIDLMGFYAKCTNCNWTTEEPQPRNPSSTLEIATAKQHERAAKTCDAARGHCLDHPTHTAIVYFNAKHPTEPVTARTAFAKITETNALPYTGKVDIIDERNKP